ncbi:MAG: HD domain-containing protein [Spirochaetaceae bacterium]|jgi:GTP pyrophosphokinase|nr:HD domain-containing protein [Spirochaetaceae bacterium]
MMWESVHERLECLSELDKERLHAALQMAADDFFAEGAGGIVLRLGMNVDCAIAVMLYSAPVYRDTVFNTSLDTSVLDAARKFGGQVESLLTGLHIVSGVHPHRKTTSEAESIRKMLFALATDVRILFIKLAERLQSLRSARTMDSARQKKIAEECLDIYAPLADRFGVAWIQDEIEDLALKYLNRDVFAQIKDLVALKKNERHRFLSDFEECIRSEAADAGLRAEVSSRAKHFYSIFQKMRKLGKSPHQLYDLFGTRILCEDTNACYALLSLVHKRWQPVDHRFKDYIANPKPNGYQSLHTTLKIDETFIEVQIRTYEMHDISEHGIASHWLYKKGMTNELVSEKYLPVVNMLKECLRDGSDAYLTEIKKEMLRDSIVVFTPQGMVVELPASATALDFAYTIHEAVGEHCSLARANGKIIPLDRPLESTHIIEIVTSQAVHPHKNWLERVVTTKALNRIRHWLTQHGEWQTMPVRTKGQTGGDGAAFRHDQSCPHTTGESAAGKQERQDGVSGAAGRPSSAVMIPVRVTGEKNFLVRFARCCNPAPGDPITGFISRGRGIIIHRSCCSNLEFINEFAERKISAEWDWNT